MSVTDREFLNKHKKFRADRKKLAITAFVFAFVVAIVVFWWLKLVGITVTGEAFCGLDEHTHGDECYSEVNICGLDEETPYPTPIGGTEYHHHGDGCFTRSMTCKRAEHVHTADCFSDLTADIENEEIWSATFEGVKITDNAADNILEIAQTQVGYTESQKNFKYNENGEKDRYTRYGEWYGNPYGAWNSIFVSFCLNYSGVEDPSPLFGASAETIRLNFEREGFYIESPDKVNPGSIAFFDDNSDGKADRAGIISFYSPESLVTVEGDTEGTVAVVNYSDASTIMGFGLLDQLEVKKELITIDDEGFGWIDSEPGGMVGNPTYFAVGGGNSNITYTSDLAGELLNVEISDLQGVPITSGSTIYIGESYIVSLEFSEINKGSNWVQFKHNEDGFLTYQIPPNIHCEPFTQWEHISAVTENGTMVDVGEFFIDETGLLRVRFNSGTEGVNFLEKFSNVDFTINFKATIATTQSGTTTEIKFNDKINIGLEVDGGAAMKTTKTHGQFDSDHHTMEYTIKVEATHGMVRDLVIGDQIYENHYALTDTIVVTDLNGNLLDPQPTVGAPTVGTGGFTLTGFPDFAAGDGFLIKYLSQMTEDRLMTQEVQFWNGVDSFGKSPDGSDVYIWAEDWVKIDLKKLSKEGDLIEITDDNGNRVSAIEWKVQVHKHANNLEGMLVIDTLGEGLEYYKDKKILLEIYDRDGTRLPDIELSWDDVTLENNSFSFQLPYGHAFHVTYYTTYAEVAAGGEKEYHNEVKAYINDKEFGSAGGTVDVVGFEPNVEKVAFGDDGKYVYFTITSEIPAIIKDRGGFVLSDYASFWLGDKNLSLNVENKPQDLVITATTKSGEVITFTHYYEGASTENTYILLAPSANNLHHTFELFFNTAYPSSADSKWILDEDSTLTISYKIPFDAKTGTEWFGELNGSEDVRDILLQNYALNNTVYFNVTDTAYVETSTQYTYAPKIIKDSAINLDGTIDYTVTFRNTVPNSGGGTGYINYLTDMAYFIDNFDEKLEYVEGSLTVTCHDPWGSKSWLNKYTYNGSIDSNSFNIAATDFVLSDVNRDTSQHSWGVSWLETLTTYRDYYKNISAGGDHVFTYKLKVKDEYLYSTDDVRYTFDNVAELTWDGINTSGTASDTVIFETGLLDKNAVRKDSKLDFDIHINRKALDILEGTDTITIEDTMTENLSVYWATIKLFYEDENGNWIDFDAPESQYNYSVIYDPIHNRLTFTLPDELHIRIDYTTLITEDGFISVNNNVTVDGKAHVTDIFDAIFRVDEHSGEAGGSNHRFALIKQDGLTFAPLPDATFVLYGPMGDPDAVIPNGVEPWIIAEDGSVLGYIGSYTSGVDGSVLVETQYLTVGGPYALVETVAPNGYELLEEPTYFYFHEVDPAGKVQTITTILAIENYNDVLIFPETGGMGTLPYTAIGTAVMSAPIMYKFLRRKKRR